jgi:iron complex outermembrane receptor protein
VHLSKPCTRRQSRIVAAIASLALISIPALGDTAPASSGETVRLDEMEVFSSPTSAQTQAITESNLYTLEPQSIISAQTINNQIAPTADYATIANIAPSIVNIETEGPGLS